MQCPSCKSASPDDVRFCLHCGQYFGEPDEATRVHARQAPPTTIRAEFRPAEFASPPHQLARPRDWTTVYLLGLIAVIALIGVGITIGMTLFSREMRPHPQQQLSVIATPTPFRTPQPTPTTRPTVESTPAQPAPTMPPVRAQETQVQIEAEEQPTYTSTPEPTPDVQRLPRPVIVVNWNDALRDGQVVTWNVPPGYYQLELTSGQDGARVEWDGTENCDFKTRDMLQFTQRCKVLRQGTLQVSNPTTFGLGAGIFVTVRVTRF